MGTARGRERLMGKGGEKRDYRYCEGGEIRKRTCLEGGDKKENRFGTDQAGNRSQPNVRREEEDT